MGPEDRPFTFGRGLHNTAARWLQPAPTPGEAWLLNMVVLEQLGEGLRAGTTEWVCCCWLASLKAAWTLAKDHLATQLEHPWEQPWSAARDRLVLAPRRRVLGPPPPARGLSCLLIPFPLGSLCRFPPLWTPFPPHPGQHRCWAGVLEVLATRAAPLGLLVNGDGTRVLHHRPSDALPRFRTYVIHQTLVRPGALLEAEWVEVKCVHEDIHKYPLVCVEMRYWAKMHKLKAAVSSRLTHPLILGRDWPGFSKLMGQCVGVHLQPVGICVVCTVLSSDAGSSNTGPGKKEEWGLSVRPRRFHR